MRRSINLVMAMWGRAAAVSPNPSCFRYPPSAFFLFPSLPACWQGHFIFRLRDTDFRRFPKAGIQSNAFYLSFTAITTVVAPWKPLSCSGSLRE